MWFWYLKYLPVKGCGAQRLFSEFPDKSWKVGSIDIVSWKKCAQRVQSPFNQAATDCVRCTAVGPCAQSGGQAKRHRSADSAREISHETGIPCSTLHKMIHAITALSSSYASNDVALSQSHLLYTQLYSPSHGSQETIK